MNRVRRDADGFDVDAELLGRGLSLEPARVVEYLRSGLITSRVERGEGEDAGRWRLSFWHGTTRFRLIVDEAGEILSRTRVSYDAEVPPAVLRRRG